MAKKDIIKDALISAKDLEEAAMDNAKTMVVETFAPEFANFFKDLLQESEVEDIDDEEFEVDDEEPMEEGTEHDSGKEPDAGRDSTDASGEMDEAELKGDQDKIDIDDDGDIDGEDLANLRKGKKDDDIVNEEEVNEEVVTEAEDEEEEEESSEESSEEESSEEESSDEKDLDIPDELFDDEGDEEIPDEEESSEEDDIKLSDDLDEEDDDEEIDFEIEDDEELDSAESADTDEFDVEDEEEEMEEGLYIRKEGDFHKITPEEYLNIRKTELEEENEKLSAAITALQGQLSEVNLFNVKLAHVNKLFASNEFTKQEKAKFVDQIDECESVEDVKAIYEATFNEIANEINPLDDFSKLLKEHRNKPEPENVFESQEMIRMKRMAGIE